MRGGYIRGKTPVNYDMATCEPYEILLLMEKEAHNVIDTA